jgi:hypothetical protein
MRHTHQNVEQGELLTGRHCLHLFKFSVSCVHVCSERMSGFYFKGGANARLNVRANVSTANVLKLRSVYNLYYYFIITIIYN